MKKTLRTVLTAAIFAAANMSAIPSMAAVDGSGQQEEEGSNTVGLSFEDWVRMTEQPTYDLYGVPPMFDPNDTDITEWLDQPWDFSDLEKTVTTVTTTSVPAPVYGPAPTTTVSDADWDTVVTTLTTSVIPQPAYGAPEFFTGDANTDGAIDSFDVITLRRMLVSGEGSGSARYYGDMNHDGKINVADLILLQRYLLGKVKDFDKYRSDEYSGELPEIEKITAPSDEITPVTTTITEPYDPVKDVVIALYGIRPIDDRIKEMFGDFNKDIQEK